MEEISHREALKKRAQALAEQEKLKDAKKTPTKSPTKAIAVDTKASSADAPAKSPTRSKAADTKVITADTSVEEIQDEVRLLASRG